MRDTTTQGIIARFFRILGVLKATKVIRGTATFCKAHNIDRRNLYAIQHGTKNCFEVAWLTWLVEDYGVSAEWLLTGKGSLFKKGQV